ncbi:DUF4837 family protein [Flavobacterium sp. '19STA2R22 D10 B1']|uniref:DUF4837 family protein n=1 Tax=Flavobacterium aerium TaxID=3037261 RepID=UPI00278C0D50|nr:DUF4837 family protein [Flavobacterium sp. '19STA2R22 D10 B1']
MKNVLVLFFSLSLLFMSCDSKKERRNSNQSTGKINYISVFIDDPLWNGEVGDSIRKKLAAPIDGLPQEEPLFSINQYPTKVFNGTMMDGRNILVVKKQPKNNFEIVEDFYAQPQNVIYISGKNIPQIVNLLEKHLDQIIQKIKNTEIKECQRICSLKILDEKKINRKFNLSLKIPSTFKYVMEKDNFMWIKKEIPSGSSSILIYQVPLVSIEKDTNTVHNIVKMRDSIGSLYIHGKLENTQMITEGSYAPYVVNTLIDNRKAYATKGTWELRNDFMSGPFINYAIVDKVRNRMVIIEGFTYAPSTPKRDLMHELEAIIKSVKIFN